MVCPECEHRTSVADSRAVELNVYRRRICKNCGYTFYTEEYELDETPEGLKFFYSNYKKMKRSL